MNGYHLVCECGANACVDGIDIPVSVFENVLRAQLRFVVAASHAVAGADEVVAADGRYAVAAVADRRVEQSLRATPLLAWGDPTVGDAASTRRYTEAPLPT
jgi:hypothetical protein